MHADSTRRSIKAGLPPGTMVRVGKKRSGESTLSLMDYDEHQLVERASTSIEECLDYVDTPSVTWLDVSSVEQLEVIARIGQHLHLHPLLLEDLVNTTQRPKLEDYGDYLFIILKMLDYDDASQTVTAEQLSLVLGPHYVVSFHEDPGDVFEGVRNRIRSGSGRLRKSGADFLAYALIDAVVDNYFVILEKVGDEIETVEIELVSQASPETLQHIYHLKREIIMLRRSVWPLREAIAFLERGDSLLISESTRIYLRDVYDHTIQVIEGIETMRDLLSGMLDIYLSSISNRTNEIVKVLTVFGAIFIPLTFLTGVWGMNFRHMPELEWSWGYPLFWVLVITIIAGLLAYFKRHNWF